MRVLQIVAALVLAAILSLVVPLTSASANLDLTNRVNAAYFPRTISEQLVSIATRRAQEISVNFSHDGWVQGTSEVIAWNANRADPLGTLITQWQNSPPHNAVLSNPNEMLIGCGTFTATNFWVNGYLHASATFGVCLTASAASQPQPQPVVVQPPQRPFIPNPAPRTVTSLPDTALDTP